MARFASLRQGRFVVSDFAKKVRRHLRDKWLNGCHGESELRAVAEFVLESVEWDEVELPTCEVEGLCDSLSEACQTIRKDIEDTFK